MLRKWKCILTNWIKCYFNESSKKEQNVNLDSLLSIISHLRENLNLDESTSSVLEARTVEEFIVEKYPDFRFENGSVEPSSEEEVYLVASLLLYFVCVISKDVDIKTAMCSKLSFADQELIMKFSKCLMEHSPISYTDVKAAIAEACGQESASLDVSDRATVVETPPALRSLHCEVRRLQAALDAEKFDKNYLQEELARTNLKFEKLLKDKEQYKLDIVNLKTKISLCCGQEAEANGTKNGSEGTAKLLKELEQIEEKLVETQGKLDDIQYERDAYRAKIEELKHERDKWLTYSQQENSRVCQLTDELEIERRHVQSLQDLVKELRQHNQLNQNRLDTSQLECDDPDTSIHSVQNLSVCSEACANVVEVQLGEERAKIVVLKQQIQALQDQLMDLRSKSENEKHTLEDVIFEKENEILSLKHRINEGIEENNHLKVHLSDELSKLNNEINELEQKLKDNTEKSRQIMEAKMLDIQILQEEKLSLLQSLSNETTKYDNIVKGLKSELDMEKNAKLCMREEYETHIMKLNDKVLNRNNELVDLQNKIFESSERLQELQSQLAKERKTNQNTVNKYTLQIDQFIKENIKIGNILEVKNSEIEELKKINNDIDKKYSLELGQLKENIAQTSDILQQKDLRIEELQNELSKNNSRIEELNNNIEGLKTTNQAIIEKYGLQLEVLNENKMLIESRLDERGLEVKELQKQLTQNDVHIDKLNTDIKELDATKQSIIEKYSLELGQLKEENGQIFSMIQQRDTKIKELQNILTQNDVRSKELNDIIEELQTTKNNIIENYTVELEQLKEEKEQTSEMLLQKDLKIKELQNVITDISASTEELNNNIEELKCGKQDIIEKYSFKLSQLKEDIAQKSDTLQQKDFKLEELQNELTQNNLRTEELNNKIEKLKATNQAIVEKHRLELEVMNENKMLIESRLDERGLEVKELQKQLTQNDVHIDKLNTDIKELDATKHSIIEKYSLELGQLKEENGQISSKIQQRDTKIEELQNILTQNDVRSKELNDIIEELQTTKNYIIENYTLELEQLKEEKEQTSEILLQKDLKIKELQNVITDISASTEELNNNIEELKCGKQDIIEKYSFKLSQLKEDIAQKSDTLQQKDFKLEELQNELTQNNLRTEELNNKIEELKATNQAIVEEHRLELEVLNENKMLFESRLDERGLEVKELQKQLTRNDVHIDKLNTDIKELDATKQGIIEKYSLELGQLKEENGQISSMTQQRDTKIEELQNILTQNDVRSKELNDIIEELQTTKNNIIENYTFELEQLKKEKEQISAILLQKDLKIKELQNVITEISASTEELNNNIEELKCAKQDIIGKYSFKLSQLKEDIAQKSDILQQKDLKIKELQNALTKNNLRTEELNNNIEELKATNQAIIEKHRLELAVVNENKMSVASRLDERGLKIRDLQKQLTQNDVHIDKLNIDIKELDATKQSIIEKYSLELRPLREENGQLSSMIQQKDMKIEELQNILTQNDVRSKELNDTIEELQVTKNNMMEKYSLELEQLKEEKGQTSEILQQKDLKIKELQSVITQNNASTKELNNNIEELKSTKQDIIENYSYKLGQLEENIVQKSHILKQKDIKIEELQNKLTQNNLQTEVLHHNIEELQATNQAIIEKHRLELEVLNENKMLIASRLDERVLEIGELQKQLTQNDVHIDKLNTDIKALDATKQSIIKKYSLELRQLKEENAHVSSMIQQRDKKIEELQNILTQSDVRCKELNDIIEELQVTKNNMIEKCNLEIEQLKEEKEQTSNILQQKDFEIEELRRLLSHNDVSTEDMKKNIQQLNRNIDDLNAINQSITENYHLKLEELNERSVQSTNVIQEKDIEIRNLRNQLIQLNADNEKVYSNIYELTVTNEDIVKKYKLDLELLKEEKVKVETVLAQKILEMEELHNRLKKCDTIVEELNENINNLKLSNEEIMKTYSLELKLLKEMCMQADNYLVQKGFELGEIQNHLVQNKIYIEEHDLSMTTTNQNVTQNFNLELYELKKEHMHTLNLLQQKVLDLQNGLTQTKIYAEEMYEKVEQLNSEVQEIRRENIDIENKNKNLTETINKLVKEKTDLETIKMEYSTKITELEDNVLTDEEKVNEELSKLKNDNSHLIQIIEENRTVITNLEQLIKHELNQNQQIREENSNKTINLVNKCSLLQEYQTKAEKELDEREKEITTLKTENQHINNKLEIYARDLQERDAILSAVIQEKDAVIGTISKELVEEKETRERCQKEIEALVSMTEGRLKLEIADQYREELRLLRKENEELVKAVGQKETFAVNQEKTTHKCSGHSEKDSHAFHYQVDNTSDLTHSSMDSIKTISDLEKIIHDKNRTITTLQCDITYLKSLIADSENKLLDVTKELEVSKENCHQLSAQLKKIVHQKNEELNDLKKQVSKMSVTENRATEIIKVSAKYQAIILKRISEIKSNTVLKELTNFGNTANGDNELRRSLNAGSVTMEDLENFLETTDRHLKRCSEKQLALQKERDRLIEVNRINESEMINLKKFLTELSVTFKTFSNIKDLYMQKFSKIVSVQRTIRREILNLDGHITDATMCKLERGYGAVMQDLSECSMNMERWVERCIGRTISTEKIKHAFSSDNERASLAATTFQNTSLEIQLEELENSFQKLLQDVMRAQKGEGAKDAQAITVMEVRAEYEDKLNRMKAKMKELYKEQIAVFQEKQKEEIADLEREVQRTREKLADSSRAYEEHIRDLTTELWSVGEKFLMKKDEAEWLRRKQRSGSLMSLQQVHSSGLVGRPEVVSRPSDTHSLRSLPVHNNTNKKRDGRGLHMSDEEGEVFDNRCLKELSSTPRRAYSPPSDGQRISELRWRNSLCPPHLKSSYPAETQFAQAVDEDEIKCFGTSGKQQRKEVGITAYKKPGPPTPSKQAGRLSATDSELRESLRVEADPQPSRKTSTPSRLRALFRSNRNDTAEGTPRTKRLSIFRKK